MCQHNVAPGDQRATSLAIVLGGIPRNRLRFIKDDISLGASCVPLRCSLPLRKRCCDEGRARGRGAQG